MPRADAGRKRARSTPQILREGLDRNSIRSREREACEAYIRSQQHEGWLLARNRMTMAVLGRQSRATRGATSAHRYPGGRIDIVVVYKVDRLTARSPIARLVELFEHRVCRSFRDAAIQHDELDAAYAHVLLSFASSSGRSPRTHPRQIAASKKKACGWRQCALA